MLQLGGSVRVVAAIPAVSVLAGSAFGVLFPNLPLSIEIPLLVTAGMAAAGAVRNQSPLIVGALVAAAFAVGGATLTGTVWRERSRPPLRVLFEDLARQQRDEAVRGGRRMPEDDEATAILEGVLQADASPTMTGVSIVLGVDTVFGPASSRPRAAAGGVQATVVGGLSARYLGDWRRGRRLRVPVQLHRPTRYLDPHVPDAERALARRGITLVGTVKSGALVEVIARGGPVDESAAAVRAFARRVIAQSVGRWSPRSAAIVAAIVIGDRAGLDDVVEERLREAGTYHVIAISGGNIAILAGLLLAVFRSAGLLGRPAMLAAMAVLIAYERIVGGGASVDRATFMALAYFGGRMLDHRSAPLNTLSIVAAIIVAAEPLSIVDPAFILTFGATLAILGIAPSVRRWNLPAVAEAIAGIFTASIATEILLLPVGALVFSRVTFAGLCLNFAAIPLMAIAQIRGMALVPMAFVSTSAATALGWIAHVSAAGLVWSAELVRFVPAAVFRVSPPATWVVVSYYLGVALSLMAWRVRSVRHVAIGVALAAGFWIVEQPWTATWSRGDGRLHVTFLDVGQGDAAFVRLPHGNTMLVDAGGLGGSASFDIGDRVVAPVLRASGVRRLGTLVLSHGDPDHIGGAPAIVREFRPREVWEGIPVPPFPPLQSLRTDAAAVHARWMNLRAGDRRTVDEVDIAVVHPDVPDWERQRVRNDDSIVLELRWRETSFLFTGDIGKAVERALLAAIRPARIRIVKVPHHGSLTSSTTEFVAAVAPQIAIVSVGRANHYGHPVPEVMDRYLQAGAQIFRTDQNGAVEVDTDGYTVAVHTFTGRDSTVFATTVGHDGTTDTKQ